MIAINENFEDAAEDGYINVAKIQFDPALPSNIDPDLLDEVNGQYAITTKTTMRGYHAATFANGQTLPVKPNKIGVVAKIDPGKFWGLT